jgi:hypothetical protein
VFYVKIPKNSSAIYFHNPTLIINRAKLGFHAVVHGNRTVCEDLWEKKRYTHSAINIQQDHKSQTGNGTRDRYKGKDDFLDEN